MTGPGPDDNPETAPTSSADAPDVVLDAPQPPPEGAVDLRLDAARFEASEGLSLKPRGAAAFFGAGLLGVVAGVATFFGVGALTGTSADATSGGTAQRPSVEAQAEQAGVEATEEAVEGEELRVVAETPPPEARAPRVDYAPLLAQLVTAHKAFHEADAGGDAAMKQALDKAHASVFAGQKGWRAFARSFHNSHGVGRFFRRGHVTRLGLAVLERVEALHDHAMDPSDYPVEVLRRLLGQAVAGQAEVEGDSPIGQKVDKRLLTLVRGILEAPDLDREEVLERLEAFPEPLTGTAVAAAVRAVSRTQSAIPADAEGDTQFLKALMLLTLDYKFVKRAGPSLIRIRDTALERETKAVRKLMTAIIDHDPPGEALRHLDPLHPQYEPMLKVLARYRQYAEAGGCDELPKGWRFRESSKGKEVRRLQERLRCEGYFDGEPSDVYAGPTMEAIKRYQEEHDMEVDGLVGEGTIRSLNVPIDRRVQQIELTLQRMREAFESSMGPYFIRVNIPAFMLTVYEDFKPIRQQRVIVGTNRLDDDKVKLIQGHINRTRIFQTRLYNVVVNPTWILPKRVEAGELKTSLEKDPDYLDKQNIKKVKLSSGTEVFIQGAGDGNVLGKVKFLLEESNAIYLHDTDKRHLFKNQRRDFSHGCIRVDGAVAFARWLLEKAGFSEAEIERAFRQEVTQRGFELKHPIPLVTEYMTVDLIDEERPVFYWDVYGYDAAFFERRLPVKETERWGSPRLRPRWVPLVDEAVVKEWRAAGKPAPRDYKPEGK